MAIKRRKLWIWVASIIGVLILILGIAAIYISAKWKPILTTKIKEGVYEASKHLYKVDFTDIHLNLLTGGVVLDNIVLTPDSNIYQKLKLAKKAPAHLFRIKLPHLRLSRVGIWNAYFDKKITMNSIVLDHPSIDMIYSKVPKRTDTVKDERTLYQQLSKSLRSIRINTISIVDADFDYYNGTKRLNAVKHLTVNVKNILVDSLSQFDSTRVFYSKDISFAMSGYQSLTKDKMYNLKVDTVRGSIGKKTVVVKGLKFIPMYPDLTFSRKYKVQKDRYDLSFSEITLTGVDFIGLNDDGDLRAKRIKIGPAKVAVFMNRELAVPNFDKGKNYPHNALKRLPIPTIVDTLSLSKVDIAYTEYNPKSKERGTLRLENLTGNVLNLTNDSLRLTKNNHAIANLTTYIMGTGKMNVKIDFNLTAPNAPFTYVGEIGAFNMKVLNPLSKSLGDVEIESGTIQSASFAISANQYNSKGVVKLYYNNLKVNLLKEGDDGQKEKKGLLSFIANTVLIRDDNPTKGEPARTANVSFQRLPQGSFFNLMWKSVFVGIREIVGIGIVPMKGAPNAKNDKKEERRKKRAARKAARAKA
jgi:hypothetical protein